MTAIAFPYLRPPADSVLASEWMISEAGIPVELVGGSLAHFDYSASLQATRRVQVDFDAFAKAIGANPVELVLECVVSIGTGGARLDRRRGMVDRQSIARDATAVSIDIAIPGQWLSQSLTLTTEIILGSSGQHSRPLAPSVSGSRLWKEEIRLGLEPAAPRFPIEVVSFARMFPQSPTGALWFLDWSAANLEHDFVSAVRLFLNEDSPDFIESVHDADEVTLRLLMNAVTVQMVRSSLLGNDGEALDMEYPASSVGGVIREWVARSFPGQTIASVKALAEFDPPRFEMALASLAPEDADDA